MIACITVWCSLFLQICLSTLQEDVVLDILGLAHQYGFVDLETAISDFLRQALSLSNVCAIFDAARLYQLNYLTRVCASFMDNHALNIITHESFNQLSPVGTFSTKSNCHETPVWDPYKNSLVSQPK